MISLTCELEGAGSKLWVRLSLLPVNPCLQSCPSSNVTRPRLSLSADLPLRQRGELSSGGGKGNAMGFQKDFFTKTQSTLFTQRLNYEKPDFNARLWNLILPHYA